MILSDSLSEVNLYYENRLQIGCKVIHEIWNSREQIESGGKQAFFLSHFIV